ncbi:MAG TPA: SGNH/GDSL hydrolase family protein [Mesorhizobium sp.]|jgi:lysophospholipase L1-like esterase|uniref:SGNH/GDSL hydrolase family protein n=1 Tax=Mesorhizobium sp. TaxID=1871066 RepID=UPI002DDCA68F|nr:SGNH/GDSL hydrolase family protein [Mesorhizobium sp.]HEV2504056.1 SGNH/GDSL hydrolase family protein [Mesorhizobium sp.]
MRTVLCYGDSLTWGYDAAGQGRHAFEDRWPSVLQAELGGAARVIPEGLNGRTTAFDDHVADCDRNGARTLPMILASHAPLDLIILLLGTNDMKSFICGRAIGARQGMGRLIDIVRRLVYPMAATAPKILLVSPPAVRETTDINFSAMYGESIAESRKLAQFYAALATEANCGFFDAGTVAEATPLDGIHLDAENTRRIGAALAPKVRDILEL